MPLDDAAREHFALVVVAHHRMVVRLPREHHLVLGHRQLVGELRHVLVRLEVRISLSEGEQLPECAGERILRAGELLHRTGVARIRGGGFRPRAAVFRVLMTASRVFRSCAR